MSVNRFLISFIYCVFFLFTGCSGKDKPKMDRKCFPVHIKIGDEKVVSSLYLELDFIDYNMPYNEFAKNASTEEEKFIRDAFKMIAEDDTAAAEKLMVSKSSIGNNATIEPEDGENNLSFFRWAFERLDISDDLSNVVILSCFYWRNLGVVSFTVDEMEKGRAVTITFERQNDKLVMPMGWPRFSQFLNTIAKQAKTHAELKYNRKDIEFDYAFTYNQGETKEHPATFLFKGKKYGVEVPSDQIKADDKAAMFYQQVLTDIKKISTVEEFQKFSEYFDNKSKDKIAGWLEKDPKGTLDWPKYMHGRDYRLEFILNADPVYIIYVKPSYPAINGIGGPEYIFRDGDDFLMTRLAFGDDFSSIMESKDFREPFLKSLLDTDK